MAAPKAKRGSTQQRAAAAELARHERLEELHRRLADGVAAIRDGQAWRDWLDTAAKFHRYSFNNQILLALQNPDATLVAGYRAWMAMGRQVRKGEKALWVLAPVTARATGSADTAVGKGDPDREPEPEGRARTVVGFRPTAVFDVGQTEGDPLPAPPRPDLLAGQAPPGLWEALAGVIAARGFEVGRCADAAAIGGANGVTNYATRTVTVRGDVDDAQAVKTLAHEAAHVLLHDPLDLGAEGPGCQGLVEVEAESVAYLVAAHHGLDTAGYTFAYIAGWAGRDEQAVAGTAGRVMGAARALLKATDPADGESSAQAVDLATKAHTGAAAAESVAVHSEATRDRLAAAAAGPHPDRLRPVLAAAQAWFLDRASASAVYAEAVAARGHGVPNARAYGVGFASPGWTGLVDHLRGAGFPDQDLIDAGVAGTTRHGRLFDRFRGRVTFPIHDQWGVVGFTARDTTGNPEAPKYLNTPATALFAKSALLFGTQHIEPERTGTLVLVEGPWDALAVTATDGGRVVGVAACGSAVTDNHLDLLRRSRTELILAPDADQAGSMALGRTLSMLAARGEPHPTAAAPPPGGDLADIHAAGGSQAVLERLDAARPAGVVYAEAHLTAHPPGASVESRVASARAAAAAAAGLTPAQRAELGALLVEKTGIAPETARGIVDEVGRRLVVLPKPEGAQVVPARAAAACRSSARPAVDVGPAR